MKQSFSKLGLKRTDSITMSWVESVPMLAAFLTGTVVNALPVSSSEFQSLEEEIRLPEEAHSKTGMTVKST